MLEPFPEKPKGTHSRTYERLQAQHDSASQASTIGIAVKLGMI
jgi:hypothetical protein